MKTLIVTAHPSSKGFTHAIANVLKEEREKKGVDVEILDLYKTDIKQNFLMFQEAKEIKLPDDKRSKIQEKINSADELVFIHPLWWLSMPAIMKNFVDQNFTSPFAYRYEKGKRIPSLKGKVARIYITSDGSFWLYLILGLPFIIVWVVGILAFCGINTSYFKIIRMMYIKKDPKKCEAMLDSIRKNSERKSISLSALNFLGSFFQ